MGLPWDPGLAQRTLLLRDSKIWLEQGRVKLPWEMADVKQISDKTHQLACKHEKEDTYPRLMGKGLIHPTTTLTCSPAFSHEAKR